MKDRIPTYPGRVKLTQVSGNIYDMERADQPSEAGTPLNKASLLKDATAALYGLTDSAVPDDVFALIASGRAQIEVGTYTGTGTYGTSNKNSLTFGFVPKLVIINHGNPSSYAGYGGKPWITGQTQVVTYTGVSGGSVSSATANCAWSDNTVEWYDNTSADRQLNRNGITYYYVAIG